jgi:SAM-dependent methyltransferase
MQANIKVKNGYWTYNGKKLQNCTFPERQVVSQFIKNFIFSIDVQSKMETIEDDTYDFVHSSHCLEHLYDPYESFENWIRICKPGGHIITTIPDEDLYEQGVWPSNHNPDHKTSWTILKNESWSPNSISLIEFLYQFKDL